MRGTATIVRAVVHQHVVGDQIGAATVHGVRRDKYPVEDAGLGLLGRAILATLGSRLPRAYAFTSPVAKLGNGGG